jgi:hypothetical protein
LTAEQATEFLTTGADALTAGGVDVRIGLSVYSIKPRLRAVDDATFRWEAVAGEQCLTALELEQMTASGQPLVRWNDSWVRAARRRGARQEVALSGAETLAAALSGVETLAAALSGEQDT